MDFHKKSVKSEGSAIKYTITTLFPFQLLTKKYTHSPMMTDHQGVSKKKVIVLCDFYVSSC